MPLTAKGNKILSNMEKEYGPKKGKSVFYASRNKGTITGVEPGYAEGGIVRHDQDPDLPPAQDNDAELVPLHGGEYPPAYLETIEKLHQNQRRAQGLDRYIPGVDPEPGGFFLRRDHEREAPRPKPPRFTPQAWPFPQLRRRRFGPDADGIEEVGDGANKGWVGGYARGGRVRYFEDGGGCGDSGGTGSGSDGGAGGCGTGCGQGGSDGSCSGMGGCGGCSCEGAGGCAGCSGSACSGGCSGCSGAGGGNGSSAGSGGSAGAEGDTGVGGCLGGCTAAAAAAAAFGAETGQTGQTGEGRGGAQGAIGTGLGQTAGLGAPGLATGNPGAIGYAGAVAAGFTGFGGCVGGLTGAAQAASFDAYAGACAYQGGAFGPGAIGDPNATGQPGTNAFGSESTAGGGGTNGLGMAAGSWGNAGACLGMGGEVDPGRGGTTVAADDQTGGRSGDRGGGGRGGAQTAASPGAAQGVQGEAAGIGLAGTASPSGDPGAGGEPSGGPSDIGGNIGGGPQGGPAAATVSTDVPADVPAATPGEKSGSKSGSISASPAAPAAGSFTGQVGNVSVSPATAANTGGLGGGTFGSTVSADPSVPGGFAAPTGDISPASFDVGNPFGDPNQGFTTATPASGGRGTGGLGGGLSTTGTMAGTSPTGFDAVGNTSLTGGPPGGFQGSVAPAGMSLDAMSLSPTTGFGPAGEFTGGRTGNIGIGTHGSVAPGGAVDINSLSMSPTALTGAPASLSNQTGGMYGLNAGSFTGGQQGGVGAPAGEAAPMGGAAPAASISDLGPAAGEAAALGGEPDPSQGGRTGGARGGEAAPMGGASPTGGGWASSGRGGEAAPMGGAAPVGGTPAGLAAGEAAPMGGASPAGTGTGLAAGEAAPMGGASPTGTGLAAAAGEAAPMGGAPDPGQGRGGGRGGEAAPMGGAAPGIAPGVGPGGWTSSGRGGEAAPMGGATPAAGFGNQDIAAAHAAAQSMQDQQMAANPSLDVGMEKAAAAAQQGQQGRGGGFTGQVGNVAVAPATAATTQGLYGGLYGSQEPASVDLSSVGIGDPGNIGGLSFGPGNALGDPNYGLAATEDIGQPTTGGRSGSVTPGGSWADQTFGSLANFGGLTGSRGTTGVANTTAAQQGYGPGFGPAAASGDWTSGGRDATLGWGAPTGLAAVAQGNLGAPMESVSPQTTPSVGPGDRGGGRSGGLGGPSFASTVGNAIASGLGVSPAAAQGLSEDRAQAAPAAQVGAPMDLAQVAQQTQEPDARSLASAITGWSDKDLAAALAPAANTISNIGSWLGNTPTGGWLGLGTPANAQDLNTFGSTKGTSGYGPGQGGAWTSGVQAAAPGGQQSAAQAAAADQALSEALAGGGKGDLTGSIETDTPAEIAAPPADLDPTMVAPAVPALERGVTDPEKTGSRGLAATLAAYAPNERGGQPSFGPQSNPFSGQQTTPAEPDPGFEKGEPRGTVTNTPLGDIAQTAENYAATTQSMANQSPALTGGALGYDISPSFGTMTPGNVDVDRGGKGDRSTAPGLGPGVTEGEPSGLGGRSDLGPGVHASPSVDFGGLSAYSYGDEPMGLNTLGIDRSGQEYGIRDGGAVPYAAGGLVGPAIKRFADVSPSSAAGMVDRDPMIGDGLRRAYPPQMLNWMFNQVGHNRRDQNPPGPDDSKQPQQMQLVGGDPSRAFAYGGYVTEPGAYAAGGLSPATMRSMGSQAHYSAMNLRPAIGRNPGVHLINSSSPGRTDRIPMRARAGSYVLPADVVSGLGQGNTMAGAKMWAQSLAGAAGPMGVGTMGRLGRGSIPKASVPRGKGFAYGGGMGHNGGPPMEDEWTPIVTAGGEMLVDPEIVEAIGHGDGKWGKRKIAESVLKVRADTMKLLKSLPRPAA